TARLFATTVPTVRKWLRRFQQHGPSGLAEQSRARRHQPHQTPANREVCERANRVRGVRKTRKTRIGWHKIPASVRLGSMFSRGRAVRVGGWRAL
ncbi:MAG TPA: helix-turn-helix domain-containing protein, partial [Candidatus Acidoferrales bacterium]|nr:helix-turn-helix domain-containing protein [Candidatus Acidoferrales bacterium]